MNGARYAILIGASEFPEEPRLSTLRCPLNDVDGLAEVLESADYGGFAEVSIFKNRPHSEVNFKINEVLNKATKDDFVLIYYSGHGKLDRSGRLHLTTSDTRLDVLGATSIPWPRVVDYLRDAYTTKVAVLLDCCYGGAAGASFRSTVEDQLQQATQARGTYVMTASTSTELAREKEEDEYGLFTKHVIEGIRSGDADLDGDGQISMDDLFRYVDSHLKQEGGQQPTMTGIDVRGELYIAKSKHSRRDERLTKLRKKLYPLGAKEVVADELVRSALEIASKKPGDMSEEQKRLDGLLDQYLAGKLSVGSLALQWRMPEAEKEPKEADQASPEPIERSKPGPEFDFGKAIGEPKKAAVEPKPAPAPTPRPVPTPAPRKASRAPAIILSLIFIGFLIYALTKIPKPDPGARPSGTSTTTGGSGESPLTTTGGDNTTASEMAKLDGAISTAEQNLDYRKAADLCHQGHSDFPASSLKYKVREFENVVEFDRDDALKLGDELYEGEARNDFKALNSIAWAIVQDRFNTIDDRSLLSLALDCAGRANDLSNDSDPYTLDTLAYAIYRINGRLDIAVDKSKKAIQIAEGRSSFSTTELASMRNRLDRIQARLGSASAPAPGG